MKARIQGEREGMLYFKRYHIRPDGLGILLCVAVLLPNLVWLLLPPPFDVLQSVTVGKVLKTAARVLTGFLWFALCLVVNDSRKTPFHTKMFFQVLGLLLLYFLAWSFYYAGFINGLTILVLCFAPCAAFLLFVLARENAFGLLAVLGFSACHVLQFLSVRL